MAVADSAPAIGRHTADIISLARTFSGLPAYAIAGTKRTNISIAYAVTTPMGPKGRPANNATSCEHARNAPHFIHRSVLPAVTCSHPAVRSTVWGIPRNASTLNRSPEFLHLA